MMLTYLFVALWKSLPSRRMAMLAAGLVAGGLMVPAVAQAANAVTTSSVNLRNGPGTNYIVVTTLGAGTGVSVLGCGNGWCEVSAVGTRGYVSQSYLSGLVNPPVFSGPPVILPIPVLPRPGYHRPPHYRPPYVRPPHFRPPHVRPPHVRPPHGGRPPRPRPPRPGKPGRPGCKIAPGHSCR